MRFLGAQRALNRIVTSLTDGIIGEEQPLQKAKDLVRNAVRDTRFDSERRALIKDIFRDAIGNKAFSSLVTETRKEARTAAMYGAVPMLGSLVPAFSYDLVGTCMIAAVSFCITHTHILSRIYQKRMDHLMRETSLRDLLERLEMTRS